MLTAYVCKVHAEFTEGLPFYIASALVAGVPEGVGVYVGYFGRIPLYDWRNRLNFYNFGGFTYYFLCGDGITRTTDESTILTSELQVEFLPNYISDGLVLIYRTTEYPPVISEIHRLADSVFSTPLGFRGADGSPTPDTFLVPKPRSLSEFEILDMPIFISQNLVVPSTPPFLYNGVVMVPFMYLGESEAWDFEFLGVGVALTHNGLSFGTWGGGSGETAQMLLGGTQARGTGLHSDFTTPTMLADGVLYVPLIEFFAGVSPALTTDAFVYNNEIHIVRRGWCVLHGHSARAGRGGNYANAEHPITVDVSALPLFVNGTKISVPPAFLSDCKHNIMLPMLPILDALGYRATVSSCGEAVRIEGGRFPKPAVISRWGFESDEFSETPHRNQWLATPFIWKDGEPYASFWCFFRDTLWLGGFASESRIEIFHTNRITI
jgi:hypothetical protein